MDGFGSDTFQGVNAGGERFWVKFHFKTDQGIRTFSSDEAAIVGGRDLQYCHHELYEHIERGEFPSWTLKVQVMPEAAAATYRIDPFDLTRSEEHTSELQSLRHLVCRLLLEKKKKNQLIRNEVIRHYPTVGT